MKFEEHDAPRTPQHIYLKLLRGEIKLQRMIPDFYDIKPPFHPYINPREEGAQLPELKEEDPSKVGSTPKDLTRVLTFTSSELFDERKLEYSHVRGAYEKERKRSDRNTLGKMLAAAGVFGMIIPPFILRDNILALPFAGASGMVFSYGIFDLLGLFKQESVPEELKEFEKLNRIAVETDTYLGDIKGKYLNPNLSRRDYKEFF